MKRNCNKFIPRMTCLMVAGILTGWIFSGESYGQESFPRDPGPCYGSGGCEPYVSPVKWTGNSDNDWYNPANWSGGTIPGANDDVLAPTGTSRIPRIDWGRAVARSLNIKKGSRLEIGPDGALTVLESTVNRGKITLFSSRLTGTEGSSASFISPGRMLCDGTVGHEESFSEAWHYFAMPLPSGHANGCWGPCWIKYWEESSASWIFFTDSSQQFDLARGYAIWSGDHYKFKGTDFNHGTIGPYPLTGNYNYSGNTFNGWNLVGNSFPCCINWGTDNEPVNGWIRTNLDKSIYVWKGSAGQYAYFNGAGDGDSLNGGTRFIFSTLGFFVHLTEPNTTGEFGMNEEVRTHCNGPATKYQGVAKNTLRIKASGNEFSDELLIRFNDKAKSGIDEYDTYKLYGDDIAPQIYSLSNNNVKLAINTYPEILKQMTVPLCFLTGENGTYELSFSQLNSFPTAVTVTLKDLKENSTRPLLTDYAYSFTHDSKDDSCRFELLFENAAYGLTNRAGFTDILVYSYEKDIIIKNSALQTGFIFVFDLLGQSVCSEKLLSKPLTRITPDVPCGYYIVRIVSDKEVLNQKVYLN